VRGNLAVGRPDVIKWAKAEILFIEVRKIAVDL
jgi:hypothetical protein